ncbi:unannotated protein [freshwater metagenome]|uniref:Unannotated protein n=1 Tax=freshwater metagenome TaxID=449393 RepID=A0A6J7MSE6_9ZZZZ
MLLQRINKLVAALFSCALVGFFVASNGEHVECWQHPVAGAGAGAKRHLLRLGLHDCGCSWAIVYGNCLREQRFAHLARPLWLYFFFVFFVFGIFWLFHHLFACALSFCLWFIKFDVVKLGTRMLILIAIIVAVLTYCASVCAAVYPSPNATHKLRQGGVCCDQYAHKHEREQHHDGQCIVYRSLQQCTQQPTECTTAAAECVEIATERTVAHHYVNAAEQTKQDDDPPKCQTNFVLYFHPLHRHNAACNNCERQHVATEADEPRRNVFEQTA